MKIITVSRSYGSGGSELAKHLADALGYNYADETFIVGIEKNVEQCSPLLSSIEDEVGPGFLNKLRGLMDNRSFYKTALSLCLLELALKSDVIVVGAGAHLIFAEYPSMVSIQVVRKLSDRVKTIVRDRNMSVEDAIELVHDKDRGKSRFIRDYYDKELFDPLMFHLVVNLSLMSSDQAVAVIAPFAKSVFEGVGPADPERWLKNRLLEKKAQMVLFHLGLTRGGLVEFSADTGRLTVKGVVGGKREKEQLLEALGKVSEVTAVTDEVRVEVLSRMLY